MAPNTEKSPATLLDKLTALESAQRSEVAKELRKVAETIAEVSDGRDTAAGPSARRSAPGCDQGISRPR
jgi:hypothetical protein